MYFLVGFPGKASEVEGADVATFEAFDNTYAQLPTRFYARIEPTPVARPRLIKLNRRLAVLLGLDPDVVVWRRKGAFI